MAGIACPKCRTPLVRTTHQTLCPKGCYSTTNTKGSATEVDAFKKGPKPNG